MRDVVSLSVPLFHHLGSQRLHLLEHVTLGPLPQLYAVLSVEGRLFQVVGFLARNWCPEEGCAILAIELVAEPVPTDATIGGVTPRRVAGMAIGLCS